MPKYRMKIEYDGGHFCGWQVQPNGHSVQAQLEQALEVVTKQKIHVMGSGRTDAGVHARGQVAAFVLEKEWEPFRLERALNALCGGHVCVRALEHCHDDFNPRYDALERYYIYTIWMRPVVLGAQYGWCIHDKMDIEIMKQEALSFLGERDFEIFCVPRHDGKSTVCKLNEFYCIEDDGVMRWHIRGNRFLHKMVRSMMGAIYEVGRGALEKGIVEKIFKREYTGPRTWAPPQGLCLERVVYRDY